MEPRKRHRPPRLPNYDYTSPGYYFVTFNTKVRNHTVLASIEPVAPAALGGPSVAVILTPAGEMVRGLIETIDCVYGDVHVDCYVIMPDHVHLILVLGCREGPPRAAGATSLSCVVNALKGLSSKRFGQALWQEGYYDHILRNDGDLLETRRYIQQNPSASMERRPV